MVDVLVKVHGCDEVLLMAVEEAALVHPVQQDVPRDVLVVEEAAAADGTADLIFLCLGRPELRLEGFEQHPHLPSACSCISAGRRCGRKRHG